MSWETLTFDCYGTLIDWERGIVGAFQREAATDGVELEGGRVVRAYMEIEPQVEAGAYRPYRDVLADTAVRVASRLGWEIDHDRAGFLAESLPEWPAFEDTGPALERLSRRFELAILSNVDDDLLRSTLDRLAIHVDWTVTAERVRAYKPAPAHFVAAIERVGGNRDRLLHAARSFYHDVAPAVTLGLAVVWVNRGDEVVPPEPVPSHVVSDLNELADWLET